MIVLQTKTYFWTTRWFWAVALAVVALPYMFVSIPPLMDLPGHMARFHIIQNLESSADLQRYYSFDWALIGNLGVDLIVTALGPVLGVEKATWAVSLVTLLLTAAALPALSKAVHGKIQPTVLLALPFLYSHNFHFGFLNYALSVALALWALVLWIQLKSASLMMKAAIFLPVSCLIWLCHAMGWGIFALCAGLIELQRQWAIHKKFSLVSWQTALRVWPLAVPLVLMLVWRKQGGAPSGFRDDALRDKLQHFIAILRDQNIFLDIASFACVALCLFWLMRERIAVISSSLKWACLGLWPVIFMMPTFVFGSYFADARLMHVAAILTILALNWLSSSRKLVLFFTLAVMSLFAVRMAVTTQAWHRDDVLITRHLSALNLVPRGSRLLVVNRVSCTMPQWKIDYFYWHLSDMAVVRRDAFVNSMWLVAGAESLDIIYNRDTAFHADPSQFIADDGCTDYPKTMTETLKAFPRDRFDFVWMLRLEGTRPAMPADLKLLYEDQQTALFRIKR
jgi:hypothetical protein